jgi:hypothetical protein
LALAIFINKIIFSILCLKKEQILAIITREVRQLEKGMKNYNKD